MDAIKAYGGGGINRFILKLNTTCRR